VHRDLKPESVMVRADGQVKVLDFGLAKLTGSEFLKRGSDEAAREFQTEEGLVMGTLRYMAPEQARGEETDSRTDVFAFGLLLYEMPAGTPRRRRSEARLRRTASPRSSSRSRRRSPTCRARSTAS
jgi:serine/threonine-protein kinase